MSLNTPNKPVGSSVLDRFLIWVWEEIAIRQHLIDTDEVSWNYTSKGIIPRFNRRTGGGSGKPAAIMILRGEWLASPPDPYMKQHMVKVTGGVSSGTYVSVADDNTDVPSTGSQNWVQIASGDALGFWI